jgi:heptosyltransferase II
MTQVPRGSPKVVLVLRFSSIGDIVLTSAAIDALAQAWPEARLVYVTKPQYGELMRHNPQVQEVVTLAAGESLLAFRRRLAALAPEAVLDLHGKARGLVLRRLVPRQCRVLWRQRPWYQSLAVRLSWRRYHATMPIAARYHDAVERLVGRSLPPGRLRHYIAPAARQEALAALGAAGLEGARPLVGMAPGALWTTKRWPVERYAELARRLRRQGYGIVLTGSPQEAPLTRVIAAQAPGAIDLASHLSLSAVAAVIDRCSVFVANDSGPMHLSRALGVPTVAFFGCTDPAQFTFDGHALMCAGAFCAPCSLHGLERCPRRDFRCMLELTVEKAEAAVLRLLAEPQRRPPLCA